MIDNLRSINSLIATKIMGWELLEVRQFGMEEETPRQKELEDWMDHVVMWEEGDYWIDVAKDFWLKVDKWYPVNNIAQAWRVLEKFSWPEYGVTVRSWSETEWKCRIDETNGPDLEAIAETASMAICLAALKTVSEKD